MLETVASDVSELCKLFFRNDSGKPLELYDYQVEIVETIMKKTHKKTLCWATTRAGKSLAVALGAILSAVFNRGERIPIVAPTGDHAKIIMSYVIQHVLDTETVMNTLAIDVKGKTAERLRAELSKKRITFKNNSEIRIISADITREGRALIGWGGNTIIVDETESIPDDIIRTKMIRMLGDSEDAIIFLISNPIKKGFMYDARTNTDWHQIKINWQDCVRVGRLTKEFVDEQRDTLSPIEFIMWYEAEYPEDTEDTLIRWKWIEEAIDKDLNICHVNNIL